MAYRKGMELTLTAALVSWRVGHLFAQPEPIVGWNERMQRPSQLHKADINIILNKSLSLQK